MDKITIIGCGNMGAAMARALMTKKQVTPEQLLLVDRDRLKQSVIADELKVRVFPSINAEACDSQICVIAVKPQDYKLLAKDLVKYVKPTQVVLSVMAGVKHGSIASSLNNHPLVIRAMPNLPAQIGMGATVYFGTDGFTEVQRNLVDSILKAIGIAVKVDREELIDGGTAISGSGPAYVFYILDSLISVAKNLGFSQSEAELLVVQTFHGAIHLLGKMQVGPLELLEKVKSKGGTTEAAINEFDKLGLRDLLSKAVKAAEARSKVLGD